MKYKLKIFYYVFSFNINSKQNKRNVYTDILIHNISFIENVYKAFNIFKHDLFFDFRRVFFKCQLL